MNFNKKIILSFCFFIQLLSFDVYAYSLREFGQELASPVTTDARYTLLATSILTGLLTFDGIEDSLGHNLQDDAVEDKPLGSLSPFGDLAGQMIPNAIYVLGMYGAYYFNDDLEYRRKSLQMLKATVHSGLVTTVLKAIIREPRPQVNNLNRDSFPSGHTASAFAFAATVGAEHAWYWGVAGYSMATLVAFSRINDNAHRLHDVAGGATIGLAYGLGLHYLHKKRNVTNFYLVPDLNGVRIAYQANF